jgi:hypothetical protein
MPNAAMYLGSSPVRQSVDIEVGRRCWTYPRKKKEDIIYIKYIYIYMKDVMEERERAGTWEALYMKAGSAKRRNYGAVKRGQTRGGLFCFSEVTMGGNLAGTLP